MPAVHRLGVHQASLAENALTAPVDLVLGQRFTAFFTARHTINLTDTGNNPGQHQYPEQHQYRPGQSVYLATAQVHFKTRPANEQQDTGDY